MSNYKLRLIPTDKSNAAILKVVSPFQIEDFDGDVIVYEEGKLYDRRDLICQVMACSAFPEIKHMILSEHVEAMHLYLTDNNRILKGMWCVSEHKEWIYKAEKHEGAYFMTGDSRVICTTDTELREDHIINFSNDTCIEQNVPNFHSAFISMYIDMYNGGDEITTNALPLMEVYDHKGRERFVIDEDNIMKVFVKVNTPEKRDYTRAELDKHLLAVMNLGMGLRQSQLNGSDLRSGVEVLKEYKLNNL